MPIYYIQYNGSEHRISVDIPASITTIRVLKSFLQNSNLYNEENDTFALSRGSSDPKTFIPTSFILYRDCKLPSLHNYGTHIYIRTKYDQFYAKLSSLSEESDRKCRELCEEMSALKASNESEVKALKAQLKSAVDSMETWIEGNNNLKQKLLTYEMSNQEVITDLKQKLCEMSAKNSELSDELSALKASKHTIESDVKLLAQEINAQNIRGSLSDLSPSCSSIGSHNQLTINSDKTRDEINIQDIFTEIWDQFKVQNKITNNLLNVFLREKDKSLTTLIDSDDSESIENQWVFV